MVKIQHLLLLGGAALGAALLLNPKTRAQIKTAAYDVFAERKHDDFIGAMPTEKEQAIVQALETPDGVNPLYFSGGHDVISTPQNVRQPSGFDLIFPFIQNQQNQPQAYNLAGHKIFIEGGSGIISLPVSLGLVAYETTSGLLSNLSRTTGRTVIGNAGAAPKDLLVFTEGKRIYQNWQ